MTHVQIMAAALLAGTMLLDALVRPRAPRLRSITGLWLHTLAMLIGFGAVLALCGNPAAAALVMIGLMAAVVMGSNTKYAVLGEPLLFSDLALVRAVFRHPQFYFTALSRVQIAALALGALAVPAGIAMLFVAAPAPHLLGLGCLGGSMAALAISLAVLRGSAIADRPDAAGDVARHGLIAALLLYWRRWRESIDPPPCTTPLPISTAAGLVVIVQCESFADPADLFGDPALGLPGLAAARAAAWQSGALLVSGFGAYTMRTEYGVIFGRDETALGFRQYDPYLTAIGEASHALPARLAPSGWRSVFVHPHDMRFYGRGAIMPAAGFADLVGLERFAPPAAGAGRYVSDAAITDAVLGIIAAADGPPPTPTLIHAVTIENHGPWPVDQLTSHRLDAGSISSAYLDLVRRGDAMLARLHAAMMARRKPAVLVFYGDHRPSIPGVTAPDGPRHTPYVMLRYGADGQPLRGAGPPCDLTPAQLHHALIAMLLARPPIAA
ncbi:LTA synthase family protein [Sandarakinorhabdus sp.]|uniref:LTA synthase family protein n=1 Tax=Sandarakinorhabdus sp. TaxID=1916663 RepID=UPI0033424636